MKIRQKQSIVTASRESTLIQKRILSFSRFVSLAVALSFPLSSHALTPSATNSTSHIAAAHLGDADYTLPIRVAQQPGPIATPEAILAELNRIRESPANYADWLISLRPYYEGMAFRLPGERGVRTAEGIDALESAIAILSAQAPLSPLTLAPGLTQATQGHLQELITDNRFTLSGKDGSTPLLRAERYGSLEGGRLVEVLSQGFNSAEAIVAFLIMDDGDRARRTQTLILSPDIVSLGTSCGEEKSGSPLCVFDFATAYTSHATTVASAERPSTNAENELHLVPTQGAANPSENVWSGPLTDEMLDQLSADLIEETNLLRADPAAYAEKLMNLRSYYDGNLVKVPGQPVVEVVEGVAALDEAIAVLQRTPSRSELAYSLGMTQGAAAHSNDLGSTGLTGHYGSDDSDPFERISRYGTWDHAPGNVAGENITYGPATLAEWHLIQLLVDDNVPSRGHREALLKPDYRQVGASCKPHLDFRIVCVMTYASDYQERS